MTTHCDATFELIPDDTGTTPTVPVHTSLIYDRNDPFAIRLVFRTGSRTEVVWFLSRELLAEGLAIGGGIGDIAIYHLLTRPGYVELTLRAPDGVAHFAAPAAELQAFLQRTYAVVPPGTETDENDLDGALAALLKEADRG